MAQDNIPRTAVRTDQLIHILAREAGLARSDRSPRVFGRWLALAFSEEHVIDTLGIPRAPAAFSYVVRRLARVAVFAERHLLPDPWLL